jgi:hypothetical protein
MLQGILCTYVIIHLSIRNTNTWQTTTPTWLQSIFEDASNPIVGYGEINGNAYKEPMSFVKHFNDNLLWKVQIKDGDLPNS